MSQWAIVLWKGGQVAQADVKAIRLKIVRKGKTAILIGTQVKTGTPIAIVAAHLTHSVANRIKIAVYVEYSERIVSANQITREITPTKILVWQQ